MDLISMKDVDDGSVSYIYIYIYREREMNC